MHTSRKRSTKETYSVPACLYIPRLYFPVWNEMHESSRSTKESMGLPKNDAFVGCPARLFSPSKPPLRQKSEGFSSRLYTARTPRRGTRGKALYAVRTRRRGKRGRARAGTMATKDHAAKSTPLGSKGARCTCWTSAFRKRLSRFGGSNIC